MPSPPKSSAAPASLSPWLGSRASRLPPGSPGIGYSAGIEVRWFALRRATVPVLPPGSAPLRVLHLSDLHMTPSQRRKQEWVRRLADLKPDLVVNTGDNLAHLRSVPTVLDAYDGLLDVPGVFVLGSNDYFAPSLRNPLRYLLPDDGRRNVNTPKLPFGELRDGFERRGWVDLSNRRGRLTVKGTTFAFAGVDDPHLGYDDLAAVAGPADGSADVRMGVTHAPYLRVVDQFARDGYETVLAGHTHGGQLCLPFGRALVTNCDLDTGSGLRAAPPPSGRTRGAARGPPGCTSRRGSGPRRTHRCGSAAVRRPPCSPSPRNEADARTS